MRNLLTFSIWIRFDENIQNMKVVCMAAWKAGKNDFWLQLQRKFKKKKKSPQSKHCWRCYILSVGFPPVEWVIRHFLTSRHQPFEKRPEVEKFREVTHASEFQDF